MAKSSKRRRFILSSTLVVLLGALIAPFVIDRRISYYTDGDTVHAPEATAKRSIRKVLWEPPAPVDVVNDAELGEKRVVAKLPITMKDFRGLLRRLLADD